MSSTSSTGVSDDLYFDRLVVMAAAICGTPMAMTNYFSNGWQHTLMSVGLHSGPVRRDQTICTYTLDRGDLFVVPDTRADDRFRDQRYVTEPPHIRFYAGMPIFESKDRPYGVLCVLDRVPRQLTPAQTANLRQLSLLLSSCLRNKAA